MKKEKITFLVLSVSAFIIYTGMAVWLYFQDKADTTGWGALGVIAVALTMVFPVFSILGGIAGQLLIRKVWLFPVINTIGAAIFVLVVFLSVKGEVKPAALLLVPAAFLVAFVFSGITMLIQKAVNSKKPSAPVRE